MKVRIKGNTIRLRLTISEVQALSTSNTIIEECRVGVAALQFILKPTDIHGIKASLENNNLIVEINKEWVKDWPTNDIITYEDQMTNVDQSTLSIVIEKDFACLDRPEEDQSDYFDHPSKNC